MPGDFILYEQDHRPSRDMHLVIFTNFYSSWEINVVIFLKFLEAFERDIYYVLLIFSMDF
jgi:hypothetical protein